MPYQNFLNIPSTGLGVGTFFLILFILWEIVWKGIGLWQAARDNQTGWFVAILILNTFGILPILYIYVFSKKTK